MHESQPCMEKESFLIAQVSECVNFFSPSFTYLTMIALSAWKSNYASSPTVTVLVAII